MSVTTIVITDPELLAKLAAAQGRIVFQGPTGDTVKMAEVVSDKLPPGFKIPFTDEQLAEFSKHRTGRPIGEVIKELKEKYGE
jgi:hypothetical protein